MQNRRKTYCGSRSPPSFWRNWAFRNWFAGRSDNPQSSSLTRRRPSALVESLEVFDWVDQPGPVLSDKRVPILVQLCAVENQTNREYAGHSGPARHSLSTHYKTACTYKWVWAFLIPKITALLETFFRSKRLDNNFEGNRTSTHIIEAARAMLFNFRAH